MLFDRFDNMRSKTIQSPFQEKLNVFSSISEPIEKNGLWIQENFNRTNIKFVDSIKIANTWLDTPLNNFKSPNTYFYGSIIVNNFIYGISSLNYSFKFDPSTNTIVESGLAFGNPNTSVYTYKGGFYSDGFIYTTWYNANNSNYAIYKYDIVNNTNSQIKTTTFDIRSGNNISSPFLYNDSLCAFYSIYNESNIGLYQVDLTSNNDTKTILQSIPFTTYGKWWGSTTISGNNVFVVAGTHNTLSAQIVKIDMSTLTPTIINSTLFSDIITQLNFPNIEIGFFNNLIYMIRFDTKKTYTLKISDNSVENLPDYPSLTTVSPYPNILQFSLNELYVMYSENSFVMNLTSDNLLQNYIYAVQDFSGANTTIIENETGLLASFNKIYLTDNNAELSDDFNAYIGDGTSWNIFQHASTP